MASRGFAEIEPVLRRACSGQPCLQFLVLRHGYPDGVARCSRLGRMMRCMVGRTKRTDLLCPRDCCNQDTEATTANRDFCYWSDDECCC